MQSNSATSQTSTMTSSGSRQTKTGKPISNTPHRRRLMAVRRRHAEHLLDILRSANKEEKERQKKIGQATSKANYMYLEKRFEVERLKTRRQVVNLLEDAEAIEAATLRAAKTNQSRKDDQNSANAYKEPNGRTRRARGANRVSDVRRDGGESNAFVEPQPGEDPNFIGTEKMRFMKYAYKHVDSHKAFERRRNAGTKRADEDRYDELCKQGFPSGVVNLEVTPKYADGSPTLSTTRATSGVGEVQGKHNRGIWREGEALASPRRCGRRRLLRQKQGILMDLKGVISRQAEALGRLAEGYHDPCGQVANRPGRNDTINKQRNPGIRGAHYDTDNCRITNKRTSSNGTRSYKGDSRMQNTAKVSRSTAESSNVTSRLRTQPQDNATSTFLSLGGRWGGHMGAGISKRRSEATSASYATYCNERRRNGDTGYRTGKRRWAVPLLPIGGK